MTEARKPLAYGFKYRDALIETAEIVGLKFGPMSVLKCLVKHCNPETGTAYPSKETLSIVGGQGLRTVKRHLRTLEDAGIIEAIAYATGGHGRATVYKFGLSAWATPRAPKKGAKMAWLKEERETYGANLSTYRAILSTYRAKMAHQPDKKEIETEGGRDPAGRGAGPDDAEGVCPEGSGNAVAKAFRRVKPGEHYPTYLDKRNRWEKEEALRAAENGERVENLGA